ncbi:GspE/PulE family protein [Hyphomicrobium sp.]|uniref:GspE/PulE family protein n=1 Tax=Hyphomicrobium sp. TaxID=82 RepID=UPI002E342801|nr:ATPase, T2SS/T4P/T4SS family [Hyphomicrobium sp.]HEX2841004.1 ATPase, T2SS/T4P/T4SS family [Hyphomicrobium sp.]
MLFSRSPTGTSPLSSTQAELSDRLLTALKDRGLLDAISAKRAEKAAQQSGDRIDTVLTRLGLVNEADLATVLGSILNIPLAQASDFASSKTIETDIPIEFLRASQLVPISAIGDRVVIATADPLNGGALDAVAFLLGKPLDLKLATSATIERAIERLYGNGHAREISELASSGGQSPSEEDVRRLEDLASDAPIIKLVNELIVRAVEAKASDIHIEPREDSLRVRFRLDGNLQTIETLQADLSAAICSRIKIMAKLNIAERRLPQDGRIKTTVRGRQIDLRVSTIPTLWGESLVLRVLDQSTVVLDFEALGFSGAELLHLKQMLNEPNGIILVTGPTGSGKTTTLYTALTQLNEPSRKLFSVEDPIEYQMPGINQVQVNSRIGLTFASSLRSILRQDPDIIMIGEIRDLETAEIAIRASLTGHLVLSTLHTNSAAASITRLIDMGVEDYLLSSTLVGVLAQRLVRRLCPCCAAPANANSAFTQRIVSLAQPALRNTDAFAPRLLKAVGCPDCHGTGYAGRTTVYELLPVSDRIREGILKRHSEREIETAAFSGGMTSMLANGLSKALRGETTVEEVLRVARLGDAAL